MAGYIPDGYTINGYIAAVPGLYEAVRFRYRPMQAIERAEFFNRRDKLPVESQTKGNAQAIVDRLESWDLTIGPEVEALGCGLKAGEPIPLTVEHVKRVNPVLFARLFSMICGTEPPDDDPKATTPRREPEAMAKN